MLRICFHDWNKWSVVVRDYSANRNQFRSCKKCNKIIKRKAFYMVATEDKTINEIVKDV